jgi:hypothetical protein
MNGSSTRIATETIKVYGFLILEAAKARSSIF